MQKQTKRLGRGLTSLLSATETPLMAAAEDIGDRCASRIPVSRLRPNPYQPRQRLKGKDLESLAQSIRKTGLIQPIIARPVGDG